MTSRPQFPPCGIKKLWFLTLGGGVTSPFENLLVMDPHSPEMHIPTNFCVQFQGVCVDRQLQSKVENPRIGQLLSFLTTQKKNTNKNRPLRTLTLYSLQSAFNPTNTNRQRRKLRRKLQSDLPKVTRPTVG